MVSKYLPLDVFKRYGKVLATISTLDGPVCKHYNLEYWKHCANAVHGYEKYKFEEI